MVADKRLRLDLYLFRARLFKSRSKASEACRNGRILVKDTPGRAATEVQQGDTIRIREKGLYRDIKIIELPGKNMSKPDAAVTWEDVTPEEVKNQKELIRQAMSLRGPRRDGARPTKKERRMMNKIRGNSE